MPKAKSQPIQATTTAVKYIGKKAVKRDNVAGTGLEWTPGQIHVLPTVQAIKLLRHPDIWADADEEAAEDPASIGQVINSLPENPQQSVEQPEGQQLPGTIDMPNLGGMTVPDILAYAQRQFHQDLDPELPKEDLIAKVISLRNMPDMLGQ
jgi:hypothetical protein